MPTVVHRLGNRTPAQSKPPAVFRPSLRILLLHVRQSFLLSIPHPRETCLGGGGVTVEIFDEDFGDPSDFLGQVCLAWLHPCDVANTDLELFTFNLTMVEYVLILLDTHNALATTWIRWRFRGTTSCVSTRLERSRIPMPRIDRTN